MAQSTKATQEFIPIKEVRNGVVVLKNGTLCIVLMASSVNFALKSADEQQSILLQFQNFLNSIEFSIQIFVQSRELDIRPYLLLLEERYKAQTADLMRIQIREYIGFIKNFTENANIMSKSFFIVIPYSPPTIAAGKGGIPSFLSSKKEAGARRGDDNFEEQRTQLEQRVSVVEQGLVRTGIRTVELGTEEVIELYYKMFNPGELEKPIALNQ